MKKVTLLCVAIACTVMMAWAQDTAKEQISADKLPKFTMSIIDSYFPGAQVVTAMKEKSKIRNAYDVELDNGVKCEFDKDGQWTMVDAGEDLIPDRMVPGKVLMYMSRIGYKSPVCRMQKDKKGYYTINLKDGTELHFDNQFRVIE